MCLCVSPPRPCHDAMRHLEAVSCCRSASQPHPSGRAQGPPGARDGPAGAPHASGGHTTSLPRQFSASPGRARCPLSLPAESTERGGCDVPSVHLSGCRPATQTPVSRVSPEPCLLHPFHVVSVWAGAGGRAWLHLGGRLGPGLGTGPQPQGTVRRGVDGTRGGSSRPRLSRALQEVCQQPPGVPRRGGFGPQSLERGGSQRPRKGVPPWRRPALSFCPPAPAHGTTPQPGLRLSPESPPPALGSLSLGPEALRRTQPQQGCPSLRGAGPPRASTASPRASGCPAVLGGCGPDPTGAVLQGGSGFAAPPAPAVPGQRGGPPGHSQSETKVKPPGRPRRGPGGLARSSSPEVLGTRTAGDSEGQRAAAQAGLPTPRKAGRA